MERSSSVPSDLQVDGKYQRIFDKKLWKSIEAFGNRFSNQIIASNSNSNNDNCDKKGVNLDDKLIKLVCFFGTPGDL